MPLFRRSTEDRLLTWAQKPRNGSSTARKPLMLYGVRQCGKTSVVRSFGERHFARVHEFNFEKNLKLQSLFEEDLNPKRLTSELSLLSQTSIDLENDLLFFDEIQACPKAINSLKYFCENLPQLAVCSAGSLLGLSLASEPFPVGKVELLKMFPMNFEEFLNATAGKQLCNHLRELNEKSSMSQALHLEYWQHWKKYLVTGGLPEVVSLFVENQEDLNKAFKEVRYRQESLVIQYLSDISKYSGKTNSLHIERIFQSTPAQLAKAQDSSVKRFQIQGVVPRVSKYSRLVTAFDWLEKAALVHRVPITKTGSTPISAGAKESLFKLYLFDVGLLSAMAEVPVRTLLDFDFGTYKGFIAENFVLQSLLASGKLGKIYSWTEGRAEIEFITMTSEGVLPIEVKAGRVTRAKSLNSFIKRHNPPRAIIYGATTPRVDVVAGGTRVERLPIYLAGS